MRLDKFLCDMGCGTRSQVKDAIRRGLAEVDGVPCRRPETQVLSGQDVLFQGRPVAYAEAEYYMLNKPAGVLSATRDGRARTVLDLLTDTKRKDLFPVGRLDKDTQGLLLITNDGALAHRLLSPRRHVDKVYEVRVDGEVKPEYRELFAKGLDIGDEKPTAPALLEIQGAGIVRLTIREGRYHQVKRMMEAVNCRVTGLKRLSMGPLSLDETLEPGEYRPLSPEEIQKLKEL